VKDTHFELITHGSCETVQECICCYAKIDLQHRSSKKLICYLEEKISLQSIPHKYQDSRYQSLESTNKNKSKRKYMYY